LRAAGLLTLASALAFLLFAGAAAAAPLPATTGSNAGPAGAIELVQFAPRRPFLLRLRRGHRFGRGHGRHLRHGRHAHERWHRRRHRHGRHDGRGHRDQYGRDDHRPPKHKHRHTHRRPHWHGPHLPPLVVIPDTAEGRERYLRSLPKRAQQPPTGQPPSPSVARQILVLVDQSQPQSLGLALARAHGLERLSSRPIALLGARVELYRIRGGRSEAAVLAALRRDRRIRSAQFNRRYFHSADKRDKARPAALIHQYGPRNVHLPEAHEIALGRRVPVAVIDSAIDMAHPDLKGAVARSFDAARGRKAAPDFHGTAVAGIIRGHGIVEGVAPQAHILAVRAFWTSSARALPETNTDVLLTAIDWAVKNGARVLNLSFVGPHDPALAEMLAAARARRVVMVAAAGNAGPKAPPAYPAAYPGVIAVTAVDEADRRYRHANRGSYIAVAAPGVDILAPVERGGHSYLSGTSFAAAYVSGIAALLLERDPNLDAGRLAGLIAAGADDLGPAGRDDDFGAGRVNALSALKALAPGLATRQ
jgi:hypothetical protein